MWVSFNLYVSFLRVSFSASHLHFLHLISCTSYVHLIRVRLIFVRLICLCLICVSFDYH